MSVEFYTYLLQLTCMYLSIIAALVTALSQFVKIIFILFFSGMNAAVRAVVRMGLYVGAKVYFIHEVSP